MILRCVQCRCPLVRGVCPQCVGDDAWRMSIALCLFIIGACVGIHACGVDLAHGQDAPRHALTDRDRADVARCLVAEAPPGDDYPAILSVLARRSRDVAWGARHYCALFVAHHPSSRQREIRMLPDGPAARRYARHWRAALAAIDAFEQGARASCDADHFGDHLRDARRARRAGWLPVDCGRTANGFWRLPRTVPAALARGGHRP